MGNLCCKKGQILASLDEQEKEFSLPNYKSNGDVHYKKQENDYNYFRSIIFKHFLYALANFSNDNATLEVNYDGASVQFSMNDPFFNELFVTDFFQSFIDNRILKHEAIYEKALNNETITSIFKKCFLEINNALGLKLESNAKQNGDENADRNSIVKKGHAIAYGILYCCGPNFMKSKAIFNIFSEDEVLKTSQNFSDFLLALFIIPSYGMAHSSRKLKNFSEIPDIDPDVLRELVNTSELKDCQNLVEVVNKMIFGDDLSASLNYESFKNKFINEDKDNSLAFMLSPSGVRYMLQLHNV